MSAIDVSRAKSPGLLRRLAVIIYDLLGLLALLILASALVTIPHEIIVGEPLPTSPAFPVLFPIYLLAVIVGYYVYFWSGGRFSLGMRAWRMRLVTLAGEPLGPADALRRLGWGLVTLVPIGLLSMYLDPDRLSWQDRLSGTRAVIVSKPKASRTSR